MSTTSTPPAPRAAVEAGEQTAKPAGREAELKRLFEARNSASAQKARYESREQTPGVAHGIDAMRRLIGRLDSQIAATAQGKAWRLARRRGGVAW